MKKTLILLLLALFAFPAYSTVSDGETVRQSFACNGSTTAFTFTFKCNSSDDVFVYAPLTSTGDPTEALTVDTDYTIAATGGSYLNGGVVTISPALAATYTVKIVRRIKQSQETPQGAITPTSIVAALDKLTRTIQDAEDRKKRSIYIPESDAVSFDMVLPNSIDRASKYLFFDSAGNATAATATDAGSTSFSTIGTNIAGAADAAAVRVLLSLDTGDNVAFATGSFSGLATFTSGILSNDDITLGAGDDLVGAADSVINMNAFDVTAGGAMTVVTSNIGTTIAITGTLDEDAMGSDSAVSLATQQSIKAYVDADHPTYSGAQSHTDGSGLITKMGEVVTVASTGTLTFETPFPNTIIGVSLTPKATVPGAATYAIITSYSNPEVNWAVNDSNTNILWIATGW